MNIDNFAADVFVSELVMDGLIHAQSLRHFLEREGISVSMRDIYLCPERVEDVWAAWEAENSASVRKPKPSLLTVLRDRARKDYARRMAERYAVAGHFSINIQDENYPARLSDLTGMPIILYGIGNAALVDGTSYLAASIVGTRAPTMYGLSVTREIVSALCRYDIVVVSGLARGIDTQAHSVCLKEGGKTIAVLAGGLDTVYPPENRGLCREIAERGCVLSELPPGRAALRQFFPARNRILSALSDTVVVVEAGEKSGTLHTASYGVSQGREVFAVPGNIYSPKSKGSLRLIQDGALVYLSPEDILNRLVDVRFFREFDRIRRNECVGADCAGDSGKKNKPAVKTKKDSLLEHIQSCDKSVDELLDITKHSYDELILLLSELEIEGEITEKNGRYSFVNYPLA